VIVGSTRLNDTVQCVGCSFVMFVKKVTIVNLGSPGTTKNKEDEDKRGVGKRV